MKLMLWMLLLIAENHAKQVMWQDIVAVHIDLCYRFENTNALLEAVKIIYSCTSYRSRYIFHKSEHVNKEENFIKRLTAPLGMIQFKASKYSKGFSGSKCYYESLHIHFNIDHSETDIIMSEPSLKLCGKPLPFTYVHKSNICYINIESKGNFIVAIDMIYQPINNIDIENGQLPFMDSYGRQISNPVSSVINKGKDHMYSQIRAKIVTMISAQWGDHVILHNINIIGIHSAHEPFRIHENCDESVCNIASTGPLISAIT